MSHAYRARMNVAAESSAPQRLKLHDFISKQKTTKRGSSKAAACSDLWKRPEFKSAQCASSDEIMKTVHQYARSLPRDASSDMLPQVVEMEATPPAPRLPPSGVPTSVDELLNTNLCSVSSHQPKLAKQPLATTTTTQPQTANLVPNLAPIVTQNPIPNLPSNRTLPSLISSLTPTPGLLDLLRPLQGRIAPATFAPTTVSTPAPVVSASAASMLVTQQAAEKAASVTKPPVVSHAKLPSQSQAVTTTAVVVVSPISGNTGGRAIVNVPRESWATATPPLRHPPAAGSYLSTSPNMQALPVLQRPPVISPQQASVPSSLPKLNPLTPPKLLASTAQSGKTQVMSMPQLHKLSATVTKTSAASQQSTPTNHPVTFASSEKDGSINTKESSGTSKP